MIEKVKIPGIYESCYGYDRDGNITGLSVNAGGRSLVENSYHYDGNGNLQSKKGLAGETSYQYDSLNRLTSVVYPEYAERFTYDKAGNRLSHQINIPANGVPEMQKKYGAGSGKGITNKNIQYTYDNCNRLLYTTETQAGTTTQNKTEYMYDICGNLISDGEPTYTYNGFNRLSKVEKANGEAFVYRYDSEGLRAEVEENGKLVQYIFNRDREVIVEESEEKGVIRYVRGLELICSDTESARNYYHYAADSNGEDSSEDTEKGNCNYYVTDEHGSVSYILNEKAGIENEYTYDAFGNIRSRSEKVHNIFAYCGEQLDSATGQYYLRARFYNPVIGRFTQQDTYHGDGLNLYAYCQNNPVMYCDPTGHDSSSAADKAWQNYIKKGVDAMNNYVDKGTNAMNNAMNNDSSGKKNSTSGNKNDNPLNQKKNEQKKKAEKDSGSKNESAGKDRTQKENTGVFAGVDIPKLYETVREHVFSKKHKNNGIMELGKSEDDILNKTVAVIKEMDAQGMIKEGPTQIKTYINGIEAEIKVFIQNGKIINFDVFKGWSERNMGNTIFYTP